MPNRVIIKHYKCPNCENISSSIDFTSSVTEWGTYGIEDDYHEHQDSDTNETTYLCSECNEEISYSELETMRENPIYIDNETGEVVKPNTEQTEQETNSSRENRPNNYQQKGINHDTTIVTEKHLGQSKRHEAYW